MDDAYAAGRRHLTERLGEPATAAFQERLAGLHPDFERYVTGFVFGEVRDRLTRAAAGQVVTAEGSGIRDQGSGAKR